MGPTQRAAGNQRATQPRRARRGVAALDYVLVLGVVLPLAAFIMWIVPRLIERVYELVCVLVSWPWM